MKKTAFAGFLALALALGLQLGGIQAEEAEAPEADAAPTEEAIAIVVVGKNYDLVSTYGGEGAEAAANGSKMALKVEFLEEGDVQGLEGKTLHYLANEAVQPLLTDEEFAGEDVVVTGKLYRDANLLVVESFELDDFDDWEPLPTGTLSGQQVL